MIYIIRQKKIQTKGIEKAIVWQVGGGEFKSHSIHGIKIFPCLTLNSYLLSKLIYINLNFEYFSHTNGVLSIIRCFYIKEGGLQANFSALKQQWHSGIVSVPLCLRSWV